KIVIIPARHNHRLASSYLDLRGLVPGAHAIARRHFETVRDHALLQPTYRIDLLAETVGELTGPFRRGHRKRRFDRMCQEEDELAAGIADHVRMQSAGQETEQAIVLPRLTSRDN